MSRAKPQSLPRWGAVRLVLVGMSVSWELSVTTLAHAQGLPPGLRVRDHASYGREDVATYGFEAPRRSEEATDTTEFRISAGGMLTGGNAETFSASTAGRFRTRRRQNQLSAAVAANYGSAVPQGSRRREVNVENVQGRLRYDRFFINTNLATFVALSVLRDRFQGLASRLNLAPGFAYYFVDQPLQRLWFELGYDLQHDLRSEDAIAAGLEQGRRVGGSAVQHSGRLFAGYENNWNEAITFDTGVEYLQALSHTENWRLSFDAGLTSRISGKFSIATTFNLRYDHNPLPNVESTDYTTSVSLVYQLL